jgi:hypothetical protein
VLALVLAKGHEGLTEEVVELVDVEPEVLERDDRAALGQRGDPTGLRHGGDVQRAALRLDLELLLEVAGRDDLDVVVDLGVDHVVEDRLVGVGLLRLPGAEQLHLARVLELTAATSLTRGVAAVVAVVAPTPARDEREREERDQQ